MLFFAVRRRSAVDEATGPRSPWEKGAGGALVAKACSSLLLFHRLRRFGLGSYTSGNMGSAVRRCSTFVRIKRGFGYTQGLLAGWRPHHRF
jgi:hypothetical protein